MTTMRGRLQEQIGRTKRIHKSCKNIMKAEYYKGRVSAWEYALKLIDERDQPEPIEVETITVRDYCELTQLLQSKVIRWPIKIVSE